MIFNCSRRDGADNSSLAFGRFTCPFFLLPIFAIEIYFIIYSALSPFLLFEVFLLSALPLSIAPSDLKEGSIDSGSESGSDISDGDSLSDSDSDSAIDNEGGDDSDVDMEVSNTEKSSSGVFDHLSHEDQETEARIRGLVDTPIFEPQLPPVDLDALGILIHCISLSPCLTS